MEPYREGEVRELVVERGACTWCHAEITYLVDDATRTCPHCGALVALPQARVLRTTLMNEGEPSPVRSTWPSRALSTAWDVACLAGAAGTLGFAAWLTVSRAHPFIALAGFFACLPLGVVVLVRFARRVD